MDIGSIYYGKLIKYGDEGDKALNMRAFSWGFFTVMTISVSDTFVSITKKKSRRKVKSEK
jgi:hypothetical protein